MQPWTLHFKNVILYKEVRDLLQKQSNFYNFFFMDMLYTYICMCEYTIHIYVEYIYIYKLFNICLSLSLYKCPD